MPQVQLYDEYDNPIPFVFVFTTESFSQPAVSGTVNVGVESSVGYVVGGCVQMTQGGTYRVTAIPDGTHLTLQNLGLSSNAAPATNILTDKKIVNTGEPGSSGTPGYANSGVATLVAGVGVAVADINITANSIIVTGRTAGTGTPGIVSYTLTNGVGFHLDSSEVTDNGKVSWAVVSY